MKIYLTLVALLLAAPALAATPAAKTASISSPEKEAVQTFQNLCVLTSGKVDKITKEMQPAIAAKAGNAIPAATLVKQTGIKADHAWALREGVTRQSLLLTTVPGICALHVNSGDGKVVKQEFLKFATATATALKAKLNTIAEKKEGDATLATYSISDPKKPNEIVLGLSTSDKAAPSGTKHLMTFSIVKKADKK